MFSRDSGELLVLVSMHSLTYSSEWRSLRIEDVRCSMLSKLSLRVAFSIFILANPMLLASELR
nr:hypothetical protein Iba_chr04aCG2080 [Ipomoea batatas]